MNLEERFPNQKLTHWMNQVETDIKKANILVRSKYYI